MRRLIILLTVLVTLDMSVPTYGQSDSSCYAIKIIKNGQQFKKRDDITCFSKKGVYIFKNVLYNLVFTDSVKVFGRVIDIRNDSLWITTSYNTATARLRNINYDTLKYSIKQIKTLRLTTDEIYGYAIEIALQDYSLQTVKEPCCNETSTVIYRKEPKEYTKTDTLVRVKKKPIITLNISGFKKGDEATTYCYPYLSNDGIAFIYERDGLIYTVGSWKTGE